MKCHIRKPNERCSIQVPTAIIYEPTLSCFSGLTLWQYLHADSAQTVNSSLLVQPKQSQKCPPCSPGRKTSKGSVFGQSYYSGAPVKVCFPMTYVPKLYFPMTFSSKGSLNLFLKPIWFVFASVTLATWGTKHTHCTRGEGVLVTERPAARLPVTRRVHNWMQYRNISLKTPHFSELI